MSYMTFSAMTCIT